MILSIDLASANVDFKFKTTDIEYNKALEGGIYEQSETITINDVDFQLRCGPYRVSLKASTSLICD